MRRRIIVSNYLAYLIMFFLLCIATMNILSLINPSIKHYDQPYIADEASILELWSFDWSKNLGIRIEDIEYGDDIVIEEISYALFPWTPKCRVKGWLYYNKEFLKEQSKLPAILLVHGLGQSHLMYTRDYPLVDILVDEGYVVYAIDAPGHGESCIIGSSGWRDAAGKIDNITENLFYQVYVAGVRGIEVLKKIDFIDSSKIAVAGASMGGLTTLVVTSIHEDVVAGVVVVASGCIECMIKSGGLANFVIGDNRSYSLDLLKKISLIDPLSYIRLASPDKKFLILFSTHDEFFPLEGFIATVNIMKSKCIDVVAFIAPNNNHYKAYPGWINTSLTFLDKVFRGEDIGKYSLCRLETYSENPIYYTYINGSSSAYRLSIKGTKYFVVGSSTPFLFPIESIGVYQEDSFTYTTVPTRGGLFTGLIVMYLSILLIGVILIWHIEPSLGELSLAIISYTASTLSLVLPYISWPNRFSINILEFIDRYGVTLSSYLGVDILLYITILCIIAPPLAFISYIVRSGIVKFLSIVSYTLLELTPFIIIRYALLRVAGSIEYINVHPIEAIVLLPLILLVTLSTKRYWIRLFK